MNKHKPCPLYIFSCKSRFNGEKTASTLYNYLEGR